MVAGIVEDDHRVLAPPAVKRVQMVHQLDQEEGEGVAVGDAAVDRVPNLAGAGHCGDEVHRLKIGETNHLVMPHARDPAALPVVGQLDQGLVDADEAEALLKGLNVSGSSILPLQYCWSHVLNLGDGAHKAVGRIQPLPQEPRELGATYLQASLPDKLGLDLSEEQRATRVHKQVLQDSNSPIVELGKHRPRAALPKKQLGVGLPLLEQGLQDSDAKLQSPRHRSKRHAGLSHQIEGLCKELLLVLLYSSLLHQPS